MRVRPIRKDIDEFIEKHNLRKKWNKAVHLLETDIRYPSLETELLEPRWRGVYSFRVDKKYRALFVILEGTVEIIKITNHYKK